MENEENSSRFIEVFMSFHNNRRNQIMFEKKNIMHLNMSAKM